MRSSAVASGRGRSRLGIRAITSRANPFGEGRSSIYSHAGQRGGRAVCPCAGRIPDALGTAQAPGGSAPPQRRGGPAGGLGAMKRLLKRFAKRALLRLHEIGLKLNLVILPKHYYVPIPDLHELRRNRARWARRSPMLGVETDPEPQLRRLRALVQPFQAEYLANDPHKRATQGDFGPGFGPVEAQALHGMIRALKPKRIIEIGSGVSTYCMLAALERNAAEGAAGRMICIEPHP